MMDIGELIENVDKNRIYKIITDLEGPKHPMDNMDALNQAGDYVIEYLTDIGIDVEVQSFKIKGFDDEFRNILGIIGDPNKPAILIGSHYDTVRFCPGANDNLSAVAVSLEVARQLMKLEEPPTVIIACFTLEEGHPGVLRYKYDLLKKHGLMNDKLKYVSTELIDANKSVIKKARQLSQQGHENTKKYKIILEETLTKEEKDIATILDKVYEEFNSNQLEESLSLVGSKEYVKKVVEDNINIKSIVNYDCLGWIKKEHGTQKRLPITPEMDSFLDSYKIDKENMVGNFIGIAGEKNSFEYVECFASCCTGTDIDFPHLAMKLPLDYKGLKKMLPDILRSDHSPFWKAGIPGVFISDFANFRSELYHTPADLSQFIDYDILKQVAQATVKYIMTLNNN